MCSDDCISREAVPVQCGATDSWSGTGGYRYGDDERRTARKGCVDIYIERLYIVVDSSR